MSPVRALHAVGALHWPRSCRLDAKKVAASHDSAALLLVLAPQVLEQQRQRGRRAVILSVIADAPC